MHRSLLLLLVLFVAVGIGLSIRYFVQFFLSVKDNKPENPATPKVDGTGKDIAGSSRTSPSPPLERPSLSHLRSRSRSSSESIIPKIIWTFWDSDDIPELTRLCMKTWKFYNPDHEIILLSKQNVADYIDDIDFWNLPHVDIPQRLADFIRIHVLKRYGGVWCDASIVCCESFDWIHGLSPTYDFVGFQYGFNEKIPFVDSYFFATAKEGAFVSEWCAEFMRMNNFETVSQYISEIESMGVDLRRLNDKCYLSFQAAAQKVVQKDRFPVHRLYLLNGLETSYYYKLRNQQNPERALIDWCTNPSMYKDRLLIKMTRRERAVLDRDTVLKHMVYESIKRIVLNQVP